MLDIKFIRENSNSITEAIKNKGVDLNIDELLELDDKRRELIQKTEKIKSEQKKLGEKDKVKAGKIKKEFKKLNRELKKIQDRYEELMLLVPNIYSDDTPIGPDESANREISRCGKIPKFNFLYSFIILRIFFLKVTSFTSFKFLDKDSISGLISISRKFFVTLLNPLIKEALVE